MTLPRTLHVTKSITNFPKKKRINSFKKEKSDATSLVLIFAYTLQSEGPLYEKNEYREIDFGDFSYEINQGYQKQRI
jgi:hypothetical protein